MAQWTIAQPRAALRVEAVAAASTANVTLVTVKVTRLDGRPGVHVMDLWLSDSPAGVGNSTTLASGAVAAGASGMIADTHVSKLAFRVRTSAAGVLIMSITDTAKTPYVVCIEVGGVTYPLVTLVTANYG